MTSIYQFLATLTLCASCCCQVNAGTKRNEPIILTKDTPRPGAWIVTGNMDGKSNTSETNDLEDFEVVPRSSDPEAYSIRHNLKCNLPKQAPYFAKEEVFRQCNSDDKCIAISYESCNTMKGRICHMPESLPPFASSFSTCIYQLMGTCVGTIPVHERYCRGLDGHDNHDCPSSRCIKLGEASLPRATPVRSTPATSSGFTTEDKPEDGAKQKATETTSNKTTIESVSVPLATRPPRLVGSRYELSTERVCGDSKKHDSLELAIRWCDSYDPNCKGIYDQNCDGTNIFTCGNLTIAQDPKSPNNGCTYIKKGPSEVEESKLYIYVIVALIALTICIIVIVLLWKRKGRKPKGTFGRLLRGQPSRFNRNRDIKSQAAFLPYNSKREIQRSEFDIGNQIGSGNFGSVCKGEIKGLCGPNTKTVVAIKTIAGAGDASEIDNFLYEIKIMGYVNPHLNLVNMIGSCTSELEESKELWLLLEFCKHGDLKTYLRDNKKKILAGGESEIINNRLLVLWSYDISQGMYYLAEKKIMHGDLAARNVLLQDDPLKCGYLVAKVADFGLSKKFYENVKYEKTSRTFVPWKWMALEYLRDNFFTLTSDVWSFAVVVWEILSFGRIPYGQQDFDELLSKLEDGYRLPSPPDIRHISNWSPEKFYQELSKVCFVENPNDRATFADVVKIIENELLVEEKFRYTEMDHRYQSTLAKDYQQIGKRKKVIE